LRIADCGLRIGREFSGHDDLEDFLALVRAGVREAIPAACSDLRFSSECGNELLDGDACVANQRPQRALRFSSAEHWDGRH